MAGEQVSLQDGMRRRRRGALFVGRRDELAVLLGNLDTDPGDDAHHFLFHVHGPGGVGKSTLLARFAQEARARGALTATADGDAMTVPAAMAAVAAGLAAQDRPLKTFDRLYATYRQRRYEADAAGAAGAASPSAGSTVVAQAGLAGLGLVPGLSLVTGAVDPGRVAEGVDRLRAAGSSRFRNEQDLRLLLDPVAVLSPVFTADLAAAASGARWLTLFFDTYERTGPALDGWLRELFVDGRYGELPANVVVTLAGQGALDPVGWADYLDLVTPLPLGPLSEAEARQLLAAKGVTDEAVVEVVLRLTDRLPLLVSTLAASRPGGPEAVGDPADTAVERFLAWERDPAARDAVLAAALPLQLDEDVYRVAVGGEVPAAADRYDWLRGLPFVDEAGGHARYHDIVRGQMLRLLRTRAPQRWRDRHERLAAAYGTWRERAGRGRSGGDLWADAAWREYRLHESYHLLCADPRAALPDTLLHVARACTAGPDSARRWLRMLTAASTDAGVPEPGQWSRTLTAIYGATPPPQLPPRATVPPARRPEPAPPAAEPGATGDGAATGRGNALPGRDAASGRGGGGSGGGSGSGDGAATGRGNALPGQGAALGGGGGGSGEGGVMERGFASDAERAVGVLSAILERGGLDQERRAIAYAIRAWTQRQAGRPAAGLADYDRAERLGLDTFLLYSERGATHWTLGRPAQAAADYARALAADPADPKAPTVRAQRGGALLQAGRIAEALGELDTAVADDPAGGGAALVFRAMALLHLARPAEALADVEECIAAAAPDADTLALRGLVRQRLGDNHQALADFDASLSHRPDAAPWVLTGRGLALEALGQVGDAADSFTRAVEHGGATDIDTLTHCARLLRLAGRLPQALAAADRACAQDPADPGAARERALALADAGRLPEAADAFERLLALEPGADDALIARARIHVALGRPAAALDDLGRLAELGPVPPWFHGRRAQLLVLTGDVAAARAALAEAGPRTLDDLLMLAVCHREEGRYADASAALDQADAQAGGHAGVALERALLTTLAEGFSAARPRWLALRAAGEPDGIVPEVWRTMVACGLGRWDDAGVHLAALLAVSAPWAVRAVLARDLACLAAAPAAPPGALAPLLTRLRATL